ncbi:metallophosphoesterase [Patescibacteria group bacterium]|nr:metallophosphoesterase [Patescibacteria group bacterium]
MKFAIINDIHIGDYRPHKGIYRKATPHAEKLLRNFVQKMNNSFMPDFVVQGGDMVEEINLSVDKKNYKKGLAILSKLNCPVYHLVGNHELKYLSIKYLKEALKYKKLYFNVDCKNFRFIFLFTKRFYPSKEIKLDFSQLKWLKKKVNTDKKIIIFSHHSLVPVNTRGNFWFSGRPDLTFIKNHSQFLNTIAGKNVKLVFNGHLHWNKRVVVNGIHYITVQSLVENTSGKIEGPPANAFTLVSLNDNFASIKTTGRGSKDYKIKI